jgi:hypothetical protein
MHITEHEIAKVRYGRHAVCVQLKMDNYTPVTGNRGEENRIGCSRMLS